MCVLWKRERESERERKKERKKRAKGKERDEKIIYTSEYSLDDLEQRQKTLFSLWARVCHIVLL